MRILHLSTAALLLSATLLVGGCDSTEEKAERAYQNAVELVDKGDLERAKVVLRTVFKLNGGHHDARMLYASIMEEQGDPQQAYSHYLLVTEQYPEDIEPRLDLARIAITLGEWTEAESDVEAARKIDPNNAELQPMILAVDYSAAARRADKAAEAAVVEKAKALLATQPGSVFAQQIVIDSLIRDQKLSAALEQIDSALQADPKNRQINQIKLSVLSQLQDMQGLGDQLKYMVETFPDDTEVQSALVRWYLANGDADGAEDFLRGVVARSGDEIPPRVTLVQFLSEVRGTDAALAELDNLIEEGLDNDTFRVLKASILFDKGDRSTAMTQIEALVKAQEPSDARRSMQTTLARMYLADGQKDRAKEVVTEVLAEDSTNVNALKLKGNWLIQEDQVRDAVLALRTALDQSPRDPETITLLAMAYERGGNRELMVESLALAFEASNAAPAETMRYAGYLIQNEKYLTAENVLLQALRLSPTNIDLLKSLAQVYLGLNDLPRADQVVNSLHQIGTPEATTVANGIEATILQRSARTDESIKLMQSMINDGQSTLAAQTAIIRTRLANGEIGEARAYMDELLAETPKDSPDRVGIDFLNGALTATEGNYDAARAIYREILATDPQLEAAWRALVSTAVRQGKDEDAEAIVDEALVKLPDSANLRWIKAGLAEKNGRIDEAIDIYEALYEADSNSTIVANNLASLITTYRDDDDSLQRAYVIARRLRGSTVPAFQDTYGWISYRMGNTSEALENLEPAAAGLPSDPAVQFHLAKAYEAVGRRTDALDALQRAVTLWDGSTLALADTARADLAALKATGDTTPAPVPNAPAVSE